MPAGNGSKTTPRPKITVAPTEPKVLRAIADEVSMLPERNGVDVLWAAQGGLWGIQRKEVGDLVASLRDGRLAKELMQMARIAHPYLVVEGSLSWSNEGESLDPWTSISQHQYRGVLWSAQQRGVDVDFVKDTAEFIDMTLQLVSWSTKARHSGLRGRPGPHREWGVVAAEEAATHLLSGIEGVGPVTAKAIWDHFGRVPLAWDVTADELLAVPGIGPGKVRAMTNAVKLREDGGEG